MQGILYFTQTFVKRETLFMQTVEVVESVLFKPYLEHSEKIIRDLAMKYFSKFKEKRQLFTISKESFNPRNCYSIEKL